MAKRNAYQERSNPFLTVLYVLVVIALIAAILYMYKNYRDRRIGYKALIEQAAQDEVAYDIESRKDDVIVEVGEEEEEEALPAATETPQPTDTPEPVETSNPATILLEDPDASAEEEETPGFEADYPVDELIDESLSLGIDD